MWWSENSGDLIITMTTTTTLIIRMTMDGKGE